MLLFSSLISLTVLVVGVLGCDSGASITCYQTHIQGLNPTAQDFCNALKNATAAFKSCMETAMVGCSGSVLEQLQYTLNTTLAGYAQYDYMCSGQCGNLISLQQQFGQCTQELSGKTGQALCTALQSAGECAWNLAKVCEDMENMYQIQLLPSIVMANKQLGCNIVVQGAPAALPEGCGDLTARMQNANRCFDLHPIDTSGGKSTACPSVESLIDCVKKEIQGCSVAEAGFRLQFKPRLDIYANQYGCNGGSTGTGNSDCSNLRQCSMDLAKQMGITLDAEGNPSLEDQQKLQNFNPLGSLSDPLAFCGMFSGNFRIGSTLECMQREMKKCIGTDPFALLAQVFNPSSGATSGGSIPGMETAAMFLAPLNKHLRLVRQDGSLNGTGWDLFMAYLCHEGCRDFMGNVSNLMSQCSNPNVDNMQATCSEYQTALECYVNHMGTCPLTRLTLYGMKEAVTSHVGADCTLNVDVALPTIPPNFYTGTTGSNEVGDGTGAASLLSASSFMILITLLLSA